jgi:Bacterial PH domain/Short C-terminal domain
MPYADELLAGGESIIRRERQHWFFPFRVAGRWVAIAALVAVLGVILTQFVFRSDGTGLIGGALDLVDTLLGWITIAALLIAVIGFAWSVIGWQSQEYVLTDHRVMHVSGVITKRASDSSLENITDARIEIPWLGRMLGFGDLTFMTASEAGIESLLALRDPIGFKRALMDAKTARIIQLNTGRLPTAPATPAQVPAAPAQAPAAAPAPLVAPAPGAAPPSAEDIARTLESLAALRDSGTITPEEFDAKKQELLGRI